MEAKNTGGHCDFARFLKNCCMHFLEMQEVIWFVKYEKEKTKKLTQKLK